MRKVHSIRSKGRFVIVCLAALFAAACLTAGPSAWAQGQKTTQELHQANALIPSGWREVVISVSDLERTKEFYRSVFGWRARSIGDVPRSQLTAWGLPDAASARYVLMANPGSDTGFVRIIDFDGVSQSRIRSHDQAWETGGIYNMNIRVADMAAAAMKATQRGWIAPSDPVRFTFGPFIVQEWIPRSFDSVRVAFVLREEPALEGWPNLKTSSRAFNSTQIVADMDRARAFYEGLLGFQPYLENSSASADPGPHVLGLSREAMSTVIRDVRIVSPNKDNEGSVELLAFRDYGGRDFSQRAAPPNLGVLMLRYPVPDVDALDAYFKTKQQALAMPVTKTTIAPYGEVKSLAVRAPDGAWLEFFED